MSHSNVEEYNRNIEVFFHGYQHPLFPKKWHCIGCFESKFTKIAPFNENLYLTRSYIKLYQFTDKHSKEKSNYCAVCYDPLYDIVEETCQLSSPTSKKWLFRFHINRHYGPPGGGI